MVDFQRARQPEQKDYRRAMIVQATADLIAEGCLPDLSLNSIAQRAGLSKANIYRYFESREAILLHLFCDDLRSYTLEIEQNLADLATEDEIMIAQALTSAFLARPRLCQLLVMISSILEHNVSESTIADAKREILGLAHRAANCLHTVLPAVPINECLWLSNTIGILVAGLWPAANPAPVAAQVLARSEFALLRPEFERDLNKGIHTLLRGMVHYTAATQ
jgi:AcrR family transcriptional regulator